MDNACFWRLSSKHGSKGVLGDVGVHIVDFAMYPVGPIKRVYCKLQTFPKVAGQSYGRVYPDANDSAVDTVEFANGAPWHDPYIALGSRSCQRLALKISGTKGTVDIDSERSTTAYRICTGADVDTCTWKDIEAKPVPNIYERFIGSAISLESVQPDFARGAEVQEVLDACFKSDAENQPIEIGGLLAASPQSTSRSRQTASPSGWKRTKAKAPGPESQGATIWGIVKNKRSLSRRQPMHSAPTPVYGIPLSTTRFRARLHSAKVYSQTGSRFRSLTPASKSTGDFSLNPLMTPSSLIKGIRKTSRPKRWWDCSVSSSPL